MNTYPGKIVFIHHANTLYGASRSLLNLMDGLRNYGVDSHVFLSGYGSFADALNDRNIPYLVVPVEWWLHNPKAGRMGALAPLLNRVTAIPRMLKNMSSVNEIARVSTGWGCQVVYSNSLVIPTGMMLSRLLRLPHVWHLREFGKLDYGLVCDWSFKLTRKIVNKANHLISISKAVSDYLIFPQSKYKSSIIYNGIAWEKDFDKHRKLSQNCDKSRNKKVFSIVGMLHPTKGQLEAIKAVGILAKRTPDIKLFIVGSGIDDYIHLCKKTARDLGVDKNVIFLGYVDDPYPIYRESDAVLVCSQNEAMGRVTVEAMAAGKPVIGYASGGTLELVRDGENGLLYQDGSEELAYCMAKIMDNNEWARSLGERAWLFAKDNYTIERYSKEIYNVLETLV